MKQLISEVYIALQEPELDSVPKSRRTPYKNIGVNHIGLIVLNIDDIEQKLISAGYKQSIETSLEKYRKRIYFFDETGFEWELIEYLSELSSERYLYE